MVEQIEKALAPLVGKALRGTARASNMLSLEIGDARPSTSPLGRARLGGEYALHVFCPWRLANGTRIVAGSGDLFTPSDPDADLETFDWDAPDATWWDTRLREVFASDSLVPVIDQVVVDHVGGFRFVCSGDITFDVFPNSSVAPHVETEFWRVFVPGSGDAHFVLRADGIHREVEA